MCVLFHHAVAREDNHLHLSAASWFAPLVQCHDMMRSFQHRQLAQFTIGVFVFRATLLQPLSGDERQWRLTDQRLKAASILYFVGHS